MTALIALITLVGAVGVWGARHAWQVTRRLIRFLDDYSGDPGIPGVSPPRPGVMQRLVRRDRWTLTRSGIPPRPQRIEPYQPARP